MEYKITLKKIFKHIHLVNKHRFLVFKLSIKAGIPFQGLMHDLSKYSPTEFFESIKYYSGDKSPIINAKRDKGYSEAWLHHKGRNKHHWEYWYDPTLNNPGIVMPLKYFKELVCDNLAAGMAYQGNKWTKEYQLTYWNRIKEKSDMDNNIKLLLDKIYNDIAKHGINSVIKSKNLEKLYNQYIKEEK